MQTRAGLALAVGGGYLLGRTKKLKLAISLGSMVAGKRLLSPGGLLHNGLAALQESPEFDDLRAKVVGSGRTAALTAAKSSLSRATERIANGGAPDLDDEPDGEEESRPRRRAAKPRSAGTAAKSSRSSSTRSSSTGSGSRAGEREPARRASSRSASSRASGSAGGTSSRGSGSRSVSSARSSKASSSGKASSGGKASSSRASSGRTASSGTRRSSAAGGSSRRGGRSG